MADTLEQPQPFDQAFAELIAYLVEGGASPREAVQAVEQAVAPTSPTDVGTQDVLAQMGRRRNPTAAPALPEPVVAPWLTNQLDDVEHLGSGQRFPSGVFEPFAKGAELAAEFTGVPSMARGVRNIADESGDGWQKAKGAGQVVMGAIPGLSAVRQAAPVFNAIAGTAPRAVATVLGASAPGVVSNAQEAKKGAEAELAKIKPPDYMAQELTDLMAQKAAKQKELNALNEKYKLAGPETQRQALDPLRRDLNELGGKITGAEDRIRQHLGEATEKARQEMPFRYRHPGGAEAIAAGTAAATTFLPFASAVKNRLGNAVEAMMMSRAATKAEKSFASDPAKFTEAQRSLSRRAEGLDAATSGRNALADYGKAVGLGTVLNFEAAAVPELVDALAYPPGHQTRELARGELTNPDYYASRALPALMWGLGTAGVGKEVGRLVTPSARVPENARTVINRGSQQSIDDLEKIARYRQATEAARGVDRSQAGAGQQAGAARTLEDAATAPVPPVRGGTSGQPSQSGLPATTPEARPRLADRVREGQSPAAGASPNPSVSRPDGRPPLPPGLDYNSKGLVYDIHTGHIVKGRYFRGREDN